MRIHEGQPMLEAGASLADASIAMIVLHGRGASGEDAIDLGRLFTRTTKNVALLAPQAAGGTWYPQRFFASLDENEPYLTSAIGVVAEIIEELPARGFEREQVMLVGFSQGACLALEFAARHPHRYAGIVGLSGAVIGPPGTKREAEGSLKKTPIFLGCSDRDPHVPLPSVRESAVLLRELGGDVTERIYPGMPHIVSEDEIAVVTGLVERVAKPAS